jgi:hypothetical protein
MAQYTSSSHYWRVGHSENLGQAGFRFSVIVQSRGQ